MQRRYYLDLPEADLVINRINARYKQGLGTNIYIIGLSGTGKSSTSQRLGEIVKESRDNKPNVFIVDSLLKLLRAIKVARIGDIVIIEEVSVLFSSRRSMAGENVAIGKIFDTIRKKLLCIISNAPLWNSIDSHMRAMAHLLIETLKINKTQKVVVSKFHELQTNPSSGKTYRHTMKRNGRDVNRMYTRMPDLEKWNEYEAEKDRFMNELYEILEAKEKKKREKELVDKIEKIPGIGQLTEKELKVHNLVHVKGLTQGQAGKELGISQPRVFATIKNIMKKMGFSKENVQNKVMMEVQPPLN